MKSPTNSEERRAALVEALRLVLANRAAYTRRLRSMNILTYGEAEEQLAFIRALWADVQLVAKVYNEPQPEGEH